MPFVLPWRSGRGRKEEQREETSEERRRERKREKVRNREGELTAVSASLSRGAVDRLLFHFMAREYFTRCPDPSDIDSVRPAVRQRWEKQREAGGSIYLPVVKAS